MWSGPVRKLTVYGQGPVVPGDPVPGPTLKRSRLEATRYGVAPQARRKYGPAVLKSVPEEANNDTLRIHPFGQARSRFAWIPGGTRILSEPGSQICQGPKSCHSDNSCNPFCVHRTHEFCVAASCLRLAVWRSHSIRSRHSLAAGEAVTSPSLQVPPQTPTNPRAGSVEQANGFFLHTLVSLLLRLLQ